MEYLNCELSRQNLVGPSRRPSFSQSTSYSSYRFLFLSPASQSVFVCARSRIGLCFCFLSVWLSVYMFVCLFIYLSLLQFSYLLLCLFVCLFVCLSVSLSLHLPVFLSTSLSASLFVRLSVHLSVCLSVFSSICMSNRFTDSLSPANNLSFVLQVDAKTKEYLPGIPVQDAKGVALKLAIAHAGILVFQRYDNVKIITFCWAKLR